MIVGNRSPSRSDGSAPERSVRGGHCVRIERPGGQRPGVLLDLRGGAEIRDGAERRVATENEIRKSARRGTLPLEAYERFGTL